MKRNNLICLLGKFIVSIVLSVCPGVVFSCCSFGSFMVSFAVC